MIGQLQLWWDRLGSYIELMAPLSLVEKILWGGVLGGIMGLVGSFLSGLLR